MNIGSARWSVSMMSSIIEMSHLLASFASSMSLFDTSFYTSRVDSRGLFSLRIWTSLSGFVILVSTGAGCVDGIDRARRDAAKER